MENDYIVRIISLSDLYGTIYSKPIPDNITRNGNGIINTISSQIAPLSSASADKYLLKGGLAKIQTRIKDILKYKKYNKIVLCTCGNILNGTAETFFSQGQIYVKLLNELGDNNNKISYHVPGKYDYIHGKEIFEQTFLGKNTDGWLDLCKNNEIKIYNATTLALNITDKDDNLIFLSHDIIRCDHNIKIGIIGLTIDQKPCEFEEYFEDYIIHGHINKDEIFQRCINDDLIKLVRKLKHVDKCNSIVLMSCFGFRGNKRIAMLEQLHDTPIDVIISSGSGEKRIETINSTTIIKSGFYGKSISLKKILLKKKDNKNLIFKNKKKIINLDVGPYTKDDPDMKNKINNLLDSYYPEGSILKYPGNNDLSIYRDELFPYKMDINCGGVIASKLRNGLHRCNFLSHPYFPAFVEGVSSNLIAECIRGYAKCQIGMIRGYYPSMIVESCNNLSMNYDDVSYGKGILTKSDFFQSLPVMSYLGRGFIKGEKLYGFIKNMLYVELNGNVYNNKGNFVFGMSGCIIDIEKNSFNNLLNGILRGPGLIEINSIMILKSFDENPFNIENYEPINMNEYYSYAGECKEPEYLINNIKINKGCDTNDVTVLPEIDEKNKNIKVKEYNKYRNTDKYVPIQEACFKYIEQLQSDEKEILMNNIAFYKNILIDNQDYHENQGKNKIFPDND